MKKLLIFLIVFLMMIQISIPILSYDGDLNPEEEKEIAKEIARLREEISILEKNNSNLKDILQEERKTQDENIEQYKNKISTLEDQNQDIETIKNYYIELTEVLSDENKILKEALESERSVNEKYIIELENLEGLQKSIITNLEDINRSLEIENTKLRFKSDTNKYLYFGLGAGLVYLILK